MSVGCDGHSTFKDCLMIIRTKITPSEQCKKSFLVNPKTKEAFFLNGAPLINPYWDRISQCELIVTDLTNRTAPRTMVAGDL